MGAPVRREKQGENPMVKRSHRAPTRLRSLLAAALLIPLVGVTNMSTASADAAISVTPNTNLVDGQTVSISVSGVPSGSLVYVGQCLDSLTPGIDCAQQATASVEVDPFGALTFDAQVWATFLTNGPLGAVDCRTPPAGRTCQLFVVAVGTLDPPPAPAFTTIAFNPAGVLVPPPPITVYPNTDLQDGQAVFVSGNQFDPFTSAVVRQCKVGASTEAGCQNSPYPVSAQADNTGFLATIIVLPSVISTGLGAIDCRAAAGVCEVRVIAYGPRGQIASGAPISFAAGTSSPPLPTLNATPNSSLVDRQVVRLTGGGYPLTPNFGPFPIYNTSADTQPRKDISIYGGPISLSQCTTNEPLTCTYLGGTDVAPDGTIDVDVPVRAAMWNFATSSQIDCRLVAGACQVVATSSYSPDLTGFAPLTFTPGSPLAPAPTLIATPNTALVDMQIVDLTGAGYTAPTNYYPYGANVPTRPNARTGGTSPDPAAMKAAADKTAADKTAADKADKASKTENEQASRGPADAIIPFPTFSTPVLQCVVSIAGREGCDQNTYGNALIDNTGGLSGAFQVRALIRPGSNYYPTPPAPTDCRVVACELRTAQSDDPQLFGKATLGFNPAAPLAPPPELTVTPSTNLRDGQLVTVRGTGFPWRGNGYSVNLQQCTAAADPATGPGCNSGGQYPFGYAEVRQDGTFETTMTVKAIVETYVSDPFYGYVNRPADCRLEACEIWAPDYGNYVTSVERAGISFDPNAPLKGLPFAAASQGANLADPTSLNVSFSGFTAGGNVRLVQCQDRGIFTGLSCDASTATTASTGNYGEGSAPFTAHRYVTAPDGSRADCAVTWCPIMVVNEALFGEEAMAFVWFSATASVPPTTPPTNIPVVNPRFTG